jgi:hypothetical protein
MTHSDDGATLGKYIEYERKDESYVTTYKIPVSDKDVAAIAARLSNADNTPFKCATDVSNILRGIGPFKDLSIARTPGGLETIIAPLSDDIAWYKGK